MDPAEGRRVRGGSDPAPHGHPVVVAGGHEFVGSGGAFLERVVAIALEPSAAPPAKCQSPGSPL